VNVEEAAMGVLVRHLSENAAEYGSRALTQAFVSVVRLGKSEGRVLCAVEGRAREASFLSVTSCHDITALVTAFATLRHPVPRLLDAVGEELVTRGVGTLTVADLAAVGRAYALLRHPAPRLTAALLERAAKEVSEMSAREVGMLVKAASRLTRPPPYRAESQCESLFDQA
jgi:hypothetical protein